MGGEIDLEKCGKGGASSAELDDVSPAEAGVVARKILNEESQLDANARVVCERLLPTLNFKDQRALADLIARVWPDSEVGRDAAARAAAVRPSAAEKARGQREPSEIVEPLLAGPGRDAMVEFFADSIRAIEQIDAQRLAVTDIPSSRRFRVVGGILSACTVYQGLFVVTVDRRGAGKAIADAENAGGRLVSKENPAGAVPFSVELGVPPTALSTLRASLWDAHRRHLAESIEYGPPTHPQRHDPALMHYLLNSADAL